MRRIDPEERDEERGYLGLENELKFMNIMGFSGPSMKVNGEEVTFPRDILKAAIHLTRMYEVEDLQDLLDNYGALSKTSSALSLMASPNFRKVRRFVLEYIKPKMPRLYLEERRDISDLTSEGKILARVNRNVVRVTNVYLSDFKPVYGGIYFNAWLFDVSDHMADVRGIYIDDKLLSINHDESKQNLESAIASDGAVPYNISFIPQGENCRINPWTLAYYYLGERKGKLIHVAYIDRRGLKDREEIPTPVDSELVGVPATSNF